MNALGTRVAGALAVLVPILGSWPDAAAAPTRRGAQPRFEPAACPAGVPADATITCGYLTVPEDRARPHGRTIRLFVTKLASRSPTPASDPVLLLVGGPGDTPDIGVNLNNPVRDRRDFYVLDQRGAGRSRPSLACPEITEADLAALGRDADDETTNERAYADAARACRKRLTDQGIRLRAYNTAENAADVADLRKALGIKEWNLAGGSYGTRLALTELRDHPEGVRTVTLGGPLPPQVDDQAELISRTHGAFDVLFDHCSADPACRATSPDLRATFNALVDRLEAAPVSVTIPDPVTGRPTTILFDGHKLPVLLRRALYVTELIPILPTLIEQLARGEGFVAVAEQILARIERPETTSWGMYYSVHCQEEIAFTNRKADAAAVKRNPRLRELSLAHNEVDEICKVWNVGRAPPRVKKPVSSKVPALILVGEYDPATPPAWARVAAKTLAHSYVFVFPDIGHDVTAQPCPRRIRNAFLSDPTRKPADACAAGS
jgi:pimeloyl-ACP methyl ester carboxylesterase